MSNSHVVQIKKTEFKITIWLLCQCQMLQDSCRLLAFQFYLCIFEQVVLHFSPISSESGEPRLLQEEQLIVHLKEQQNSVTCNSIDSKEDELFLWLTYSIDKGHQKRIFLQNFSWTNLLIGCGLKSERPGCNKLTQKFILISRGRWSSFHEVDGSFYFVSGHDFGLQSGSNKHRVICIK